MGHGTFVHSMSCISDLLTVEFCVSFLVFLVFLSFLMTSVCSFYVRSPMFVLLFSLYDVFCYSHIHVYLVRRFVKGSLTVILAHRRPRYVVYMPTVILAHRRPSIYYLL